MIQVQKGGRGGDKMESVNYSEERNLLSILAFFLSVTNKKKIIIEKTPSIILIPPKLRYSD